MKKFIIQASNVVAFIIVFLFSSCFIKSGGEEKINYVVAKNYFFNNNAVMPSDPLVTSIQVFDELFGAAAFMGKDGEPTNIDFSKQSVIAVVLPETSEETDIKPQTLIKDKNKIQFTYKVIKGKQMTYTIRPMLLIVVAKKDVKGCEVVLLPNVSKEKE
jgi:hypothetical protein